MRGASISGLTSMPFTQPAAHGLDRSRSAARATARETNHLSLATIRRSDILENDLAILDTSMSPAG
jgi:hypothetical protein